MTMTFRGVALQGELAGRARGSDSGSYVNLGGLMSPIVIKCMPDYFHAIF